MEIAFHLDWVSLWVGVALGWLSGFLVILTIAVVQWRKSQKPAEQFLAAPAVTVTKTVQKKKAK